MKSTEIWQFLAGFGLFLYGMSQLERVLKNISGRSIKIFLQSSTKNLFKGILGGALVTGIVQSSSVVALIVLAFVEAGVITFRNALGVIFGTNLGTTISSWIVATVGFKIDILDYSFPIIAISSIGIFFSSGRKNLQNLFNVLFALGILFLGLGLLKESSLKLVEGFDVSRFSGYPAIAFVFIGFILTSIIQSSSATVAITLTAIHAGVISFPAGAALVIGSEVGTTIKILFWGVKGSADKKRVAWGNFIFNVFTTVFAFITLNWHTYAITDLLNISDPLIALVFFQSSINALSIIFFIPVLGVFSNWLETKFVDEEHKIDSYASHNPSEIQLVATDIMQQEAFKVFHRTLDYNRSIICKSKNKPSGFIENIKSFAGTQINTEAEYGRLKQTEGDILSYYGKIHLADTLSRDTHLLFDYVSAVRQCIVAAKAIKDIKHNIDEFEASTNKFIIVHLYDIEDDWMHFENDLLLMASKDNGALDVMNLSAMLEEATKVDESNKVIFMETLKSGAISEIQASTLFNVNREIFSSKKRLLNALQNILESKEHKEQIS
jgi:phosphate:Na+ symporter